MEPATLVVYFGELLKPHLRLALRVPQHPRPLLLYHCLEAFSDAFRVFKESGDELPDPLFELVGPVRFCVHTGLVAFSPVLDAAVVRISRGLVCPLDRVGDHPPSATAAA